ncbi:MAG: formimidoylglutamate deiminase [marine bacterium B5-7]|nr:MAG: formimidoylglutamate deiminase [marine bacterium B5-7]
MNHTFQAPSALLEDGWHDAVTIAVNSDGWIESVDVDNDSPADHLLNGPVIPGIPNIHSHAHQRAMAGLAEKASGNRDSFWSWREAMYRTVETLDPDNLYDIARQLYLEMLRAGYTSVAEFQYLHHDINGAAYQQPAEMTLACLQAARDVGIGFTALPVLYAYSGFGSKPAESAQRRFINNHDTYMRIVGDIHKACRSSADFADNCSLGIAPHSLRAVDEQLLSDTLASCADIAQVVHIHIAEQVREVEESMAFSSQRPVEWLLDKFDVNERWCLVHATHTNTTEIEAIARSSAVVGLCPTTEANLGDGFFDLPTFMANNGRFAIGSDSQISISPVEELRWLEYGQRLVHQLRNVSASDDSPHTGQTLLNHALVGGRQASGRDTGAITVGKRADFIVLDNNHPRLAGRSDSNLIDSFIFSGNDTLVTDVFVGGRQVISNGHHHEEADITSRYQRTITNLGH